MRIRDVYEAELVYQLTKPVPPLREDGRLLLKPGYYLFRKADKRALRLIECVPPQTAYLELGQYLDTTQRVYLGTLEDWVGPYDPTQYWKHLPFQCLVVQPRGAADEA